jgi:hypothetical protein
MPRGGHNKGQKKHPANCKCGNCPKVGGRPKSKRPTDAAVAERVLAKENAFNTWCSIIQLEKRRLGMRPDGTLPEVSVKVPAPGEETKGVIDGPDYPGKYSVIPLVNTLSRLEDRLYGRPVTPVAHQTKEPLEVSVTIRRVGA